MAVPDHRIARILGEDPNTLHTAVLGDPIEDAIARALHLHDRRVPYEVSYALEVWSSDYKRTVIEAFLIADCSVEEIHNTLKIPLTVIKLYMRYFFDKSCFRDRLDVEDYVHTRIEAADSDDYARMVFKSALDSGKLYLLSKFGRDQYTVPMKSALEDVFQNMFCKHAELKSTGAMADGSKEQRSFVRALLQTASAMPTVVEYEDADQTSVLISIKQKVQAVQTARKKIQGPDQSDDEAEIIT